MNCNRHRIAEHVRSNHRLNRKCQAPVPPVPLLYYLFVRALKPASVELVEQGLAAIIATLHRYAEGPRVTILIRTTRSAKLNLCHFVTRREIRMDSPDEYPPLQNYLRSPKPRPIPPSAHNVSPTGHMPWAVMPVLGGFTTRRVCGQLWQKIYYAQKEPFVTVSGFD